MSKFGLKQFSIWSAASISLGLLSCATSKKLSQSPLKPGIDIIFTGEQVADTIYATIAPIPTDTTMQVKEYIEAIENGRTVAFPVIDKRVHISPDSVPSVYKFTADVYVLPRVYLRNNEHADISVSNLSPMRYEVEGLKYMAPFMNSGEFHKLRRKLWTLNRHKLSEEEFSTSVDSLSIMLDTIIPQTNTETATHWLSMLDDDIVLRMFEKLPPEATHTLYYTYACARRNSAARAASHQAKLDTDIADNATVGFSLNSLDGTAFDIASLRGKWVVIDFWVSWCGPCRRGFETMKKVYADHSDKLEVVAIACGDQTEMWQQLVKELELPWVNLLAPAPESQDGTVGGFPVPAFPTKIVINPQGQLIDYTVGEDEEFYARLQKMIVPKK